MKNRIFAEVSHEDDFLCRPDNSSGLHRSTCLLCGIREGVAGKNQRKRYQESRSCKKEQTLAKKAVKRFKTKPKNNPESEDEFNNKGAYETLVLTEEEHRQFDEAENEIDELTDKIRQLEEIHSVTYRAIFVCSVLFVASLLVFTVTGLVQT